MREICKKENCELAQCCGKSNRFVPGAEIAGSVERKKAVNNEVSKFLCDAFQLTEELGAASFVRQLIETNITLEHNAPKVKFCYALRPNYN